MIKPRQKKLSRHVEISINNENIWESDSVEYLDVLIVKNLTWSNHIKHVTIKVSKGIGILSKIVSDKIGILSKIIMHQKTY